MKINCLIPIQEKAAIPEEELQKMKEDIEKEINEGIRPSAPLVSTTSKVGDILNSFTLLVPCLATDLSILGGRNGDGTTRWSVLCGGNR
jgi:hypothetical protein